eukprot:GFUD01020079.1.p1 GENE.GFUD01020079.1~~GFUD01020079.1.p1  ORF type:complete len:287 (-),score=76.72 GFUD01020079.1:60-920(-)
MSLKNLSRCLESSSRITPDISFVFNKECPVDQKTVTAHKVILSSASNVFETQFYGEIPEADGEIDIVDASYEAFKAMIEFIYNIKHDWEFYCLHLLAEVYYLGEKYYLDDLKIEVVEAVAKFQVSKDNFLEVATLAEKQSHHPILSENLFQVAAKFLQVEFKGEIKKVLELFSEVEIDPTDPTNSFILHKLMTKVNEISPHYTRCNNCKTMLCLHGKEVTKMNFVAGARIKIAKGKNYNAGINPYATTERLSCSKTNKFLGKKVTGYISCYFGKGSYFYECQVIVS